MWKIGNQESGRGQIIVLNILKSSISLAPHLPLGLPPDYKFYIESTIGNNWAKTDTPANYLRGIANVPDVNYTENFTKPKKESNRKFY